MAAADILLGPSRISALSTADIAFVARLDREACISSRPCQLQVGGLQRGFQSSVCCVGMSCLTSVTGPTLQRLPKAEQQRPKVCHGRVRKAWLTSGRRRLYGSKGRKWFAILTRPAWTDWYARASKPLSGRWAAEKPVVGIMFGRI